MPQLESLPFIREKAEKIFGDDVVVVNARPVFVIMADGRFYFYESDSDSFYTYTPIINIGEGGVIDLENEFPFKRGFYSIRRLRDIIPAWIEAREQIERLAKKANV